MIYQNIIFLKKVLMQSVESNDSILCQSSNQFLNRFAACKKYTCYTLIVENFAFDNWMNIRRLNKKNNGFLIS